MGVQRRVPVLRIVLLGLVVLAALPGTLRAQDAQPGGQEIATEDGLEKLRLPAGWRAEAQPHVGALGMWRIDLPDGGGTALLVVNMAEGARDDLLGTAQFAHQATEGSAAVKRRFAAQPVPHALGEEKRPDGATWPTCHVVRVVRRRGYLLGFACRPEAFEKALPGFLAAVPTFESARGEYPDIPDRYKTVLRDGYEYRLHPAVRDTEVGSIHRFLLAQETAYAKRYGAVPKPAQNAILVVLHAKAEDAGSLSSEAAASKSGWFGDPMAGAIYAVPLAGDDPQAGGLRAEAVAIVLHAQVFGNASAGWHFSGDTCLAFFEGKAGKPFPQVAESLETQVPRSLHLLRDLAAKERLGPEEQREAMVYVAFFRSGAKPHAEAFAAYVKAVRAGADAPDAFEKHLAPLNPEQLRTAAQAFAASFKPVKGR